MQSTKNTAIQFRKNSPVRSRPVDLVYCVPQCKALRQSVLFCFLKNNLIANFDSENFWAKINCADFKYLRFYKKLISHQKNIPTFSDLRSYTSRDFTVRWLYTAATTAYCTLPFITLNWWYCKKNENQSINLFIKMLFDFLSDLDVVV